jgi:hypothetical protein
MEGFAAGLTLGYVPTIAERIGAISAYDYGPSGATFTPPIDLVIAYDPANIPQGFSESDLVIRMWDGTAWIDLETTIDSRAHTATAKVSHLTLFALFAASPVSLTLTPEVTPTPLSVVVTPTASPMPPVPVIRMNVVIAMLIAVLIVAVAYMVLRGR